MIAAAKVAHADPDGYTLLLHQDALAAGMTLYPERTFDAEKDFAPIGLVNTTTNTLAGRPSLPANNFDELLRWMKEPGQTIKVGHPGVGSFGHLAEVLIFQELGIKVTQVPYRGAGPALVDLLAGQVDLGPISAVVAMPLVNADKLKAYSLIGRKPVAGLPQLKTMGQLGYAKADIDFWHMLLAPARTPRPIIEKLNRALRVALADAKLRKTYTDGGMDLYPQDEETLRRSKPDIHCRRNQSEQDESRRGCSRNRGCERRQRVLYTPLTKRKFLKLGPVAQPDRAAVS